MGDPSLGRQLGPKAVSWEQLVTVIVLDDFSHGLEGHGIGAELIRTHVVQGGGLQGIPCRETGAPPHGHLDDLSVHLPITVCIHPPIHSPTLYPCTPSLFYPVIQMFICPSIHPPTPISIHQFIHLLIHPFTHPLAINPSFSLPIHLHPSASPFSYPTIHPPNHLSIYPSIHLFTCYFSFFPSMPFFSLFAAVVVVKSSDSLPHSSFHPLLSYVQN